MHNMSSNGFAAYHVSARVPLESNFHRRSIAHYGYHNPPRSSAMGSAASW